MSKKENSPHTLFHVSTESTKHFRLFLDSLISEGAVLHDLFNTLHDATADDTLEIRINSSGGFVKYGQQFINIMKDRFKDRCVTIIDADAASMAAVIFMAGDKRIVYPHSTLMIHDISMYLAGKASESRKEIELYSRVFKGYFKRFFSDVLEDDEIEDVFKGVDYWFTAEDMCKNGMATHVNNYGTMLTAEEFLETLKPIHPEVELKKIDALLEQIKKGRQELEECMDELEEEHTSIIEKREQLLKEINENSDSRQATQ